jgi:hypothetical protein
MGNFIPSMYSIDPDDGDWLGYAASMARQVFSRDAAHVCKHTCGWCGVGWGHICDDALGVHECQSEYGEYSYCGHCVPDTMVDIG